MNLLTRLKKSVRHRASYAVSDPLSKLLGATGLGLYGPGPALRTAEPLRQAGIPVETMRFDKADLEDFWRELSGRNGVLKQYCGLPPYWEKKPQYYFTWREISALMSREDSVFVDIASTPHSPYIELVRELAKTQHIFMQDLVFPPGIHGNRIGGSAADLPLGNDSVDAMALHCSFEHFEGSADTGFIREAGRVLRPGGKVCIAPLYMGEYAFTMCDPAWGGYDILRSAERPIHCFPRWGERHGRFYSAETLKERVLTPARAAGLTARVVHFENVLELHPACYTHFGLVLEKPARM